MKRTSGRIGIGLVFASIWLGACMTEHGGASDPTEGVLTPQAQAPDAQAARDVVLAVRGRLERANLPMGNPLSDNSRSVPGSLELLGASAFAETTKAASANGLLASPKFKTSVVLASHANGAFRVTDDRSRLSVDVSLRGATNATREDVGGYSVYRSAYAHGAHIMHRTSEQGTEDYVFFPDEVPAAAELRYDIALSDDVAGLRLVSNTLEMLDKGGTPRLRMNPPYAVDGDGNAVTIDVAVEGCAYDSSGAMPWRRPTVDPKSRQCTVRLTWDGSVKAPLVVDPQWVHTANEITPRLHMSATVIGNKVVVAGGDNANGAGGITVFDTVESYDPDTMTWTAGPKMPGPRTDHSAVLLNINGKSFLYVMGGRNANGECIAEVIKMDLSNGGWLPGVNMPVALAKHTSTVFPDQRVLLTGGISSGSPSPVPTTLLYNPMGSTWNKTPMMSARADHTATLVHDKYVLVAGGRASTFLDSMEIFAPDDTPWTMLTTKLPQRRARQTAVRLKDNRVLFAGGETDMEVPVDAVDICTLDPVAKSCTWTQNVPQLGSPRSSHGTAYLELADAVVVLGGRTSNNPASPLLGSVQYWSPGMPQWQALPSLNTARMDFQTVMPVQGHVMVIGGVVGPMQVTGTAELFGCMKDDDCTVGGAVAYCSTGHVCKPKKKDGEPCDRRAAADQGVDCLEQDCNQCASGPNHCVDGVCCNSECTGSCEACNQNGNCKPVTGAPNTNMELGDFDLPKRQLCSEDPACGGACNGILRTCDYPTAGTVCETACNGSKVQVKSCDGLGACGCPSGTACKYDQVESCAPYVCDAVTQDCHVDCIPAKPNDPQVGCDPDIAVCNIETRECVGLPTQCDQEKNEMVLSNGTRISCGFFQCVSGACLTVCDTAYDCLPDLDGNGNRKYVCDEARRCVPFADADTTEVPDVTCSTSPVNQSSRFGWLAALALAGAFAARRNRARA